ncbi:MAG TPA: BadF/BadG/BcrA/BcrD ATPase family protein [Saccharofermentans sp.]|nr:BadF/BadG/BcrA/BcrD ATPase family protein [Saccharofermentans sp.]
MTKKFRLFCAIDLGQSNTRWVVSSESEEITEGVTGKGIINVLLPNGREVLRGNLESVREATNMFDFQVVSIAATGIEKERAEYSVAIEIAEKVFRGKRVILNSDIVAFHLANFDRGPGIILHAGSGTFAYGTDGLGNSVKVGGWGYLLGDIGGGYWTGLKGVQEAVKSLDGLNKSERLARNSTTILG